MDLIIKTSLKEAFTLLKKFQKDNSLEEDEDLNKIKSLIKEAHTMTKELKNFELRQEDEDEPCRKKEIKKEEIKKENEFIKNISKIYTDGCFNKNSQPFAWGSVIDDCRRDIISYIKESEFTKDMVLKQVSTPLFEQCSVIEVKFDDVKTQQNNGAELLSMVVALRIADKHTNIKEIFNDSQTIVDYWSNPNHQLKNAKLDKNKIQFIKEAKMLRKKFEGRGGKITKISGDNNIADLGYHK